MNRSVVPPSTPRRARTLAASVAALLVAALLLPASAWAAVGTVHLPDPATLALDEVYAGGAVWSVATDFDNTYLYKIDPVANQVTQRVVLGQDTPTGNAPYSGTLVAADGSLWTVLTFHNEVVRVDPNTGAVQQKIHVGRY